VIPTKENAMERVLMVQSVEGGSQAESLGIRPGDVLATYDGRLVSSSVELVNAVSHTTKAGKDKVAIVIVRSGTEIVLDGVPGKLGMNVEEIGINVEEVDTSVRDAEPDSGNGVYASDYDVAKGVAAFIAFAGWALVVIGVIGVLVALQQATQSNRMTSGGVVMIALMPGVISAGLGFLLVMGAQVTRAVVDTADYAREILKAIQRRVAG
jgi:uncharacterized membrane protein